VVVGKRKTHERFPRRLAPSFPPTRLDKPRQSLTQRVRISVVVLFVCHSRRESAVAFLFVILSAAEESASAFCLSFWRSQNLRRCTCPCLFFCLSFPKGICFCLSFVILSFAQNPRICLRFVSPVILSFAQNLSRCPWLFLTYNSQLTTFLSRVSTLQIPLNPLNQNHLKLKNTWHTRYAPPRIIKVWGNHCLMYAHHTFTRGIAYIIAITCLFSYI